MMEDKAVFIARNALFCHLNKDELQEVERVATVASYAPGRILYRPGEKSTALYILMEGVVHLYHLSTDGRKVIIATPELDSSFGVTALLTGAGQSSFAEIIKEARLCLIGKHEIEQLIERNVTVTAALLKSASSYSAQIEAQLVNTTFKSMNARLATLLLQLARDTRIIDGLSQEELAEYLGTYRETVSVALRDLKDARAIELGRKHIEICNEALLRDIANV